MTVSSSSGHLSELFFALIVFVQYSALFCHAGEHVFLVLLSRDDFLTWDEAWSFLAMTRHRTWGNPRPIVTEQVPWHQIFNTLCTSALSFSSELLWYFSTRSLAPLTELLDVIASPLGLCILDLSHEGYKTLIGRRVIARIAFTFPGCGFIPSRMKCTRGTQSHLPKTWTRWHSPWVLCISQLFKNLALLRGADVVVGVGQ